jgi:hypothetical protein
VVITGTFTGTTSFGGDELSSAGENDVYVARYSGDNGLHLGSMRLGGTGAELGLAIASGSQGQIFVGGRFKGFADIGGVPMTGAGTEDGFVLALSAM